MILLSQGYDCNAFCVHRCGITITDIFQLSVVCLACVTLERHDASCQGPVDVTILKQILPDLLGVAFQRPVGSILQDVFHHSRRC